MSVATLYGWLLGLALLVWPDEAAARLLHVGPHELLRVPSQAATLALEGDQIVIDPGVYEDCAVWRAGHLTIEASGPGAEIEGKTCLGRGIFITLGANITIRGLTFAHAHVPGHNGAGIAALGDNLTVENSRFIDNENGILAGGSANSTLRVVDSEFRGNGSCEGACAHGIYAGSAAFLLDVERCHFIDTRVGHHVKSRARNTVITGSRIEDGATGTSSYLIDVPNGGNVLIQDNVLQKGPNSDNQRTAISIGEEEAQHNPTGVLIVRGNRFTGDQPVPTLFVRNHTATPVTLEDNDLRGNVVPLSGLAP